MPAAVRSAVQRWETKTGHTILRNEPEQKPRQTDPTLEVDSPGYQAIAFLVSKGCTAEDIVGVLEGLYFYGSTAAFGSQKRKREKLIDRTKNLVLRFRRDARDAEQLLGTLFPEKKNRAETPEVPVSESASAPREASDATDSVVEDDISPDSFVLHTPEVWEVMRTFADELENYINWITDPEFPASEIYKRKWAGTTYCLVAAAALIKEATGKPHFEQLETLLEQVWPNKIVRKPAPEKRKKPRKDGEEEETEIGQAVQKKVNRFKTRNPDFVLEYLKPDPAVGKKKGKTVREKIMELLS